MCDNDTDGEKPLLLYTTRTPNGFLATIFLEELRAAYGAAGPAYEAYPVCLADREHKEPWYLSINPNGLVPALVDRERGGFKVFESVAIVLYLARQYDTEFKMTFDPATEPDEHSEMLQWVAFTHSSIGPMARQVFHFTLQANVEIPYAIARFKDELQRAYGVLDARLRKRDYLAGAGRGRYSIADSNAWPFVHSDSGGLGQWPNVEQWCERIAARRAVQAALLVPPEGPKTRLSIRPKDITC